MLRRTCWILFQHHLVPRPPKGTVDDVYLVMDPTLEGLSPDATLRVAYSGLRLAYDLACCRRYVEEHPHVRWIDVDDAHAFYESTLRTYDEVHYYDPHDRGLSRTLSSLRTQHPRTRFVVHPSPLFLLGRDDWDDYLALHPLATTRRWLQHSFYTWHRKRRGVLVDPKTGKPTGGRWSYDAENRETYRGDPAHIPKRPRLSPKDLRAWLDALSTRRNDAHFRADPLRVWPEDPQLLFPVSRAGALRWLRAFVTDYLPNFGRFQDALVPGQHQLFHGCLSPMLNRGMLLPGEVLEAVLGAEGVPLSSREGFVRQLLGWREFSLFVYECLPPLPPATWRSGRALTRAWYGAAPTGLVPLDDAVAQAWRTGYLHHIQRLMVVANAMLLLGVSGRAAHAWFMEFSLDSYPCFMELNLRMGLFLDGGVTTTKPYVSSSRYLARMSTYPSGASATWTRVWDALYSAYVLRHREALVKIRDYGLIVRAIERMAPTERRARLQIADAAMTELTK